MKIAVIDNTCNTGYVLLRFLNDAGHDADLIILGGMQDHMDPRNDTFTDQYFDHIIHTGWQRKGIRLSAADIRQVLDKYDFIIGSDYAPAVCHRIHKTLDIFMPHGTDLFEYPFRTVDHPFRIRKKDIGDLIFARWQRKGIRQNTRFLLFDATNEKNEQYVRRFSKAPFQRIYMTPPHIYYPHAAQQFLDAFVDSIPEARCLRQLKNSGYHIFFHHCQHTWKNPAHPLFYKGTDILIRGYKHFVEQDKTARTKLVLFKRGHDCHYSQQLISDLHLDDHIVWMPSMPRKHIMACLRYADLGIGELGHSWLSYNVATEFMAMGVPIIHNCDQAFYRTLYPSLYPMYTARTEADILMHLKQFMAAPEAYRQTGTDAQQWWRTHMADRSLNFILERIAEKAAAKR